jgi:hypothetical protein
MASSGAGYAPAMKEFTDWLCRNAAAPDTPHGCYGIDPSCYADEPLWLEDASERAHIAGMAEFLSSLACLPPPQWSEGPGYFLEVPAFAGGRRSRDHLLAETPAAFRRRLLFCGPVLQRFFKAKPRPTSAES